MFCMPAGVSCSTVFTPNSNHRHMKSADSSNIIQPSSVTFTLSAAAENRPKTLPLEIHLFSNARRKTAHVFLLPSSVDFLLLVFDLLKRFICSESFFCSCSSFQEMKQLLLKLHLISAAYEKVQA